MRDSGRLSFLFEKTGPVEDEFKAVLLPILRSGGARAAYLCVVEYDGSEQAVALCVRFQDGAARDDAFRSIAAAFRSMFGADQHLDLMALDDEHELLVKAVAENFVH